MKPQGFPPELRIRHAAEFSRVYELRCRVSDHVLLVYGAPNRLGHSRIGLSVSRKLGNAVRRARLKRMLRESFRRHRDELPNGWDWILIPRGDRSLGVNDFHASLVALTQRLVERWEDRSSRSGRSAAGRRTRGESS